MEIASDGLCVTGQFAAFPNMIIARSRGGSRVARHGLTGAADRLRGSFHAKTDAHQMQTTPETHIFYVNRSIHAEKLVWR